MIIDNRFETQKYFYNNIGYDYLYTVLSYTTRKIIRKFSSHIKRVIVLL